MLTKYIHFTKNLLPPNSFIAAVLVLLSVSPVFGGDVPIERDFLTLPDGRWIKLQKIDWEKTRIALGKGKGAKKVVLWFKDFESDDNRTWAYAFFVRLKANALLADLNHDRLPEVGISTYDMGNGMLRDVLIYTVKKNCLELLDIKERFDIAADENVF